MASTVWLHPRYWISCVRDSALLTQSSKYRVRRRYCHSVTGPSLCSELLANFFTGISLCELPLVVFFPFSVRGQGPGTRRLYVTICCTARKSTERETCRILTDCYALKSVHLQNLTPSRNLVSHVHKGMVAIIFLFIGIVIQHILFYFNLFSRIY